MIANLPGLLHWGSSGFGGGFLPWFGGGGMPGPQIGIGIDIDPDQIPSPSELRRFLFPSVYTLTAGDDPRVSKFATQEAFPASQPRCCAVALRWRRRCSCRWAWQSARVAGWWRERSRSAISSKIAPGDCTTCTIRTVNHFPPQAIVDDDGKPLLSWRVAILPFLEQQELYNEFKLDEPWDSEHNKALIPRMPAVFAIPGAVDVEPGQTFFRGFSGPSAFFDPKVKDGIGINVVTDGTSNTLAIVEAKTAVVWTKPDEELAFDPKATADDMKKLLSGLGGHFEGGFNGPPAARAGSVRFFRQTIQPMVLKALITRDGGEVIDATRSDRRTRPVDQLRKILPDLPGRRCRCS